MRTVPRMRVRTRHPRSNQEMLGLWASPRPSLGAGQSLETCDCTTVRSLRTDAVVLPTVLRSRGANAENAGDLTGAYPEGPARRMRRQQGWGRRYLGLSLSSPPSGPRGLLGMRAFPFLAVTPVASPTGVTAWVPARSWPSP